MSQFGANSINWTKRIIFRRKGFSCNQFETHERSFSRHQFRAVLLHETQARIGRFVLINISESYAHLYIRWRLIVVFFSEQEKFQRERAKMKEMHTAGYSQMDLSYVGLVYVKQWAASVFFLQWTSLTFCEDCNLCEVPLGAICMKFRLRSISRVA